MNIAITSRGSDLSSPVDKRFGRAARFLVINTDTGEIAVLDNHQSVGALKGAGIQAAELIAKNRVEAVITGHCGPNAFRVLSAAGIRVFNGAEGTVAETLERFKRGELSRAAEADVDGHWL